MGKHPLTSKCSPACCAWQYWMTHMVVSSTSETCRTQTWARLQLLVQLLSQNSCRCACQHIPLACSQLGGWSNPAGISSLTVVQTIQDSSEDLYVTPH